LTATRRPLPLEKQASRPAAVEAAASTEVEKRPRLGGEAAVMASTAAVSGLNYLYTVIMIWLLPPGQYVVVGSISALLLIFGTVAGASVPWVLAREIATSARETEARHRAVCFAVGAALVQGLGAALATCLVAARYAAPPTLVIAFVTVILIFAASTAAGYLQGRLRFTLLAGLRVTEVLVKIATATVLVLTRNGAGGAIAGFAFGAAAVAAVGGLYMTSDLRWVRGALFDRKLWRATAGLLSIQGGVAVMASLDVVVASLAIGTSARLATYQAANILGRVPLFIGAALSLVVFPRLAVFVRERAGDIRDSLRLYTRVCIPATVVMMTAPPGLIAHLFPRSYGHVASVLPWAAVAGFGIGLVNLSTTYFQAAGIIRRPTLTLGAGIVAGVGLDYVGLRLAGPRGLALAVAVQALAVAATLMRDCRRLWPGSLRSLGRTCAGAVLLATPLFVTRSSVELWFVAALAFAVLPVADAVYRASSLRGVAGERPRVLHLGYEDPRRPGAGGGSVRTGEINRRLARDFDITVVCAAYPGCEPRLEDGVRYVHAGIAAGPWVSVLSYFAAIPLILWRNPSDLVVEDFGAPFSSVAVPWLTSRPVVGVVQWLFAEQKREQYHLPFHLIERFGVRAHRRLIAVSGELGQILEERNHRAEVAVVPNGLDANACVTRRPPRRGIAYLGRIEIAQKGLDLLLRSYAKVAGQIEQDLHIGGDGPDRAALEDLAHALGVSSRVHFIGRVAADDRFQWLAGADLLAMPSRYETFGMVAAEALAVATPVVAFDIPCLREVVGEDAGVLVPPFDVDRYSQALRAVASDPSLAAELGRSGPAQVASLRWETLASSQGQLYRAALEGRAFELSQPDGVVSINRQAISRAGGPGPTTSKETVYR
jgi:glycosyltransferase involved in cell wall biosynthesis/O-antigen/teichoic acid export membrane protein